MIPLAERQQILQWVEQARASGARLKCACEVLGISARSLQRWTRHGDITSDARSSRAFVPTNKLTTAERENLLNVANSEEFAHLPPSQLVPILAERGEFLASESTFYRLLRQAGQLQHRQASRPAAVRQKPKALSADAPNQLYSWDITYLPTTIRGVFFYLYLFMDIYSRKIVGWQVYEQESSEYAADIVQEIARTEAIDPNQVTLHSDNGGPMKGASMLATLQKLGIMPSFSRPAVSNDNPYSESLFRTLKYRPEYPGTPFTDLTRARRWVSGFVHWYNFEHRHSALKFVTPSQRHAGADIEILAKRKRVYENAKAKHPERWSGDTRCWKADKIVYLNPEKTPDDQATAVRNVAA